MNTVTPTSIQEFRDSVDSLLEQKKYVLEKILPTLQEGRDYFIVDGRKSLSKGGAEKIAAIYQLVATFIKDHDTVASFRDVDGIVAYVCTLTRAGTVVGQGRGSATLEGNDDDPNKTIKMAQKSAFVDGVIRATGLSDIFTQDIENMGALKDAVRSNFAPKAQPEVDPEAMTEKQRKLLTDLILQRIGSRKERERWLSEVESGLSKFDASELISSFIIGAR